MTIKTFARSLLILVAAFIGTPGFAQTNPNQGPGGPILVITNGNQNFGKFYAEILRTEGFNEFTVAEIGSVTATTLNSYDVVILAKMSVTTTQASMFSTWVTAGGNLIAMDPAPELATLLGITPTANTLSNGYLLVNTATRAGAGSVDETIQFHGTARMSGLNGASSLATLYSDAVSTTGFPAVTLRNVGASGGQAAGFMFDLATSVVYTRQGNPAWAGQERDGNAPLRSDDMFFGASASDPAPNWVDMNKVDIPQADEQQRLLANLIIDMNADRKPLPRFWYFPHDYRSAVIMSGDDHGFLYVATGGGTEARFNQFLSLSQPGCSVADWECIRGTSYVFTDGALTDAAAASFQAQGFEVGLHVNTFSAGACIDYNQTSLTNFYSTQRAAFSAKFPSIPQLYTERHHCIVWSDWASGAKVELANGMRLDTNYYYWPASFANNVPGHFTGSAMPMRFADLDGTLIDVYQAVTQMTDESGQIYPFTPDTLLERAVGTDEQYGVYTINAHTDQATILEADSTIAAAVDRGIPVVSARQMLTWLDGRNSSAFGGLTWSAGNTLNFSVTQASGAVGLQGMLPWRSATQTLNTLSRNGTDVPFEIMTVKGVEYAKFPAASGSYAAAYTPDITAPHVISRTPSAGGSGVPLSTTVRAGFSEMVDTTTINSNTVQLRDASNNLVPATITYISASQAVRLTPVSALQASTTYTVTIRGGTSDPRVKDLAGNAMAATDTWTFTTAAPATCPCNIFAPTAVPTLPSDSDTSSLELGVKFRSDVSGYIKGVRFYKGPLNGGVHTGSLWTSSGALLSTATFSSETAGGWQQVLFAAPVPISANTTYIASYFAPNGGYANTTNQFSLAGIDNGVLHALSDVAGSGNGVFIYGSGGQAPNSSWQGSNYWVDVVFDTVGGSPTDVVAPTIAINSPVPDPTYTAATSPLTLGGTASDNVGLAQVTWTNDRGGSGTATGTTAWSIVGIPLQSGTNNITVTARDFASNVSTDTLAVSYTPPPDNTPPSVTARTPAPGAVDVDTATTITVTFDDAMSTSTIGSNTLELRNAANVLIPVAVTYNPVSFVATLTPTAALALNTTYTVTVKGGATDPRVKDVAGNALTSNVTWSFTTTNGTVLSLWPNSAAPVVVSDSETSSVELGVKFRSDVAGYVTGVRFYKGVLNTGVHTGTLWSSTGELLATATFVNETGSGWQQVKFASPVAITADTLYVVSYHAPNGRYSYDANYFTGSINNGVLHAPASAEVGGNGVYAYGAATAFPASSFAAANYWVDVLFTTSTGPDVTPPIISTRSPVAGAINVATNTPVTVTFNEPVDSTTVNTSTFELRNGGGTLVPSTVSFAGSTATLVPSAALATSTTYTVTVRGGSTDPRIKDAAGNALAANDSWSFTTSAPGGTCAANAITAENCLTGNSPSEWDVSGAGDASIQGFATQISVNRGSTIQFKIDTNATNYRLDIYRMGYYGGLGARKITTVNPSASLPQNQPDCLTQASTGLIDCGNWSVSASWAVPSTATSGIYFAKLVRADNGGASHIMFIVRNDASTSDLVLQTSDTTWQAYNNYGGNSLYLGAPGTNPGRAYKVSYNRPFNTRAVDGGQDWVFNAEYPMVRFLEANGYDVSYISGVDTDRTGSLLLNHRTFVSVGHDEYWSKQQRNNVETARNSGVNLAFFSGNEVFWKTRWENSIDGANTAYRTLVSYKETHAGAKIDPSADWTGTWRDPRFSPPADGGRPENSLTGTIFMVNSGDSAITVPSAEGKMRFWRNTTVATLAAGQVATLPPATLGYEWDSDLDNGSRPAGLIRLSDTSVANVDKLQDNGSTYATGTANHALTFYRHASGARVFGAGTIQWTWGLDATHDRAGTAADVRMQQATVNLFADMAAQPATLRPGLVAASPSTDNTAPSTVISSPAGGVTIPQNLTLISGTATDTGGGVVGGVEVSVDGGATWHPATGRGSWTYQWSPTSAGPVTIRVRAVDDSGNLQATPTEVSVTVGATVCPCSIWPTSVPTGAPDADPGSVELGTRFRATTAGSITALRFYKAAQNTGTHVGSLWSSTGTLLGQVTFSSESASGWQTQNLATPVAITANTWYVVSYHTNSGFYNGEDNYFANNSVVSGPLEAAEDGDGGANGLYQYSSSPTFPASTFQSENYWVDVVFDNTGVPQSDNVAPVATITAPTNSPSTTVTSGSLALGGTASDAVGVTQVTWTNNRGGSGTATGTTAWSVASVTLQSGVNLLTVTARDAAGNTGSDTLSVTYNPPDTTLPVVTITSPTSSSTTTVATTPLNIGGTASDAGGITQVTWSSNRGGSGTATGTTSWSVTGIVLQTGSNILTVTATDTAGNVNTDTLTVTYSPDLTPPSVTINSPTTQSTLATASSSINLGGTSSDIVAVTQVTWSNDRGGSGTASGTANWSVTGIALQTGVNVLTITARDAAGNPGTDTLTVTYTPDTTPPVVTITTPTSQATLATSLATLNLGGTASDAVGVTQVTWSNDRGGSGTASGLTGWSVANITLQSGANILTVTARDAVGNTSTDTLTVTYTPDTVQPVVNITGPSGNPTATVTSTPLTLSGTASDAVGVTQVTWSNDRGGSGNTSGTTNWSVSNVVLQPGANVLTVSARDAAGNIGTDVITVTYSDATQPNISITSPTSNSTLSTTVNPLNIGGTASDNFGVTQVTWTNDRGGSGTASGTTSWTVSGIVLQTGANLLTVTARDAAGNTRTDTLTVTYTPDSTLPSITISTPTSNPTFTTTSTRVSLGGSASDNVGVTQVSWVNNRGGSGNASGTTAWTANNISLQSGTNILTVTARDAAGNIQTDVLTVTRN